MFDTSLISLRHLKTLTDDNGIIQHSIYSVPNRKTGYCVDDNARALIAAAMYHEQYEDSSVIDLVRTYLGFLSYVQREDGKFRDFMNYDRSFSSNESSKDSLGRAIWASGYISSVDFSDKSICLVGEEIFKRALNSVSLIDSPRALSFIILGIYHYLQKRPKEEFYKLILVDCANKLIGYYKVRSSEDWQWFEDSVAYSNGRIPQAMYRAYEITNRKDYLDIAESSLGFLSKLMIKNGKLYVIGNNGWCAKGGEPALFDQQPIDAACMVDVYAAAFQATQKSVYKNLMNLSFEWFLGKNVLNQPLYDSITGGCYDGLQEESVNLNQGAESVVSYIMANLTITSMGVFDPEVMVRKKDLLNFKQDTISA